MSEAEIKAEFLAFLKRIDAIVSCPAAEYVPALREVMDEIDKAKLLLK